MKNIITKIKILLHFSTFSFRNLLRNKKRNLATGVVLSLGFAAFIILGGYLNWTLSALNVYTVYNQRAAHISIYKKDGLTKYSIQPSEYTFGPEEQAKIEKILSKRTDIEFFAPKLLAKGLIGNGCRNYPFVAVGIDPQIEYKIKHHQEVIKWVPKSTIFFKGKGIWEYSQTDVPAIAVAIGLSKLLGKTKVYDEFASNKSNDSNKVVILDCAAKDIRFKFAEDSNVQLMTTDFNGGLSVVDAEIVGMFRTGMKEEENTAVVAPLKLLQSLYNTSNVTMYSVWLYPLYIIKFPLVMYELSQEFAKENLQVDMYPWFSENISPYFSGSLNFLNTLVGFIFVVLSIVIIFSVFNSVTLTVMERSQEVGMLRSLGFSSFLVLGVFLLESLYLSAISVVCGIIVSLIGVVVINSLSIPFSPPGITEGVSLMLVPNIGIFILVMGVIAVLSLVATFFAVRSVSKANIATLLLRVNR